MYTHKWAVYYNNETQVASCKALSVVWSQGPDTWYVISNNCTLNVVVILQKNVGQKYIQYFSYPPTENFAHIKWVSKYLHLHTRIVQKCAELHGLAIMLAISGDLGTRLALGTATGGGGWGIAAGTVATQPPSIIVLQTQWSDFAIKAQCTYLLSRRLFPWLSIKRKNI